MTGARKRTFTDHFFNNILEGHDSDGVLVYTRVLDEEG